MSGVACKSMYDARADSIDRRHLVRLWLRDPANAWRTPEALSDRWDRVYKDVKPFSSVFPLEPYIRSASSGSEAKKGSA